MSAGDTFIIKSLNDVGAADLYKNLDPKQLLELLFKSNPARLLEIIQAGLQLHSDYEATKTAQTKHEAIDALMKTLPQEGDAFKAVPQIKKSLKELESISKAVQQRQIRIADGAFNSSHSYTALFRAVALGGGVSLPLLGLDAAIGRLDNGLGSMREELSIDSMSKVQGWSGTEAGYGAYIHKFVSNEMQSYPGPGRVSKLDQLKKLGRKLGGAAKGDNEKWDRSDRSGRSDRASIASSWTSEVRWEKSYKSYKEDKPHKASRPVKEDRMVRADKTGQSNKSRGTEKAVTPVKSVKSVKLVKSEKPANTEKADSTVHEPPLYHYFYVWHPGTDWYPDFEKRLKKDPLPSNFGGYSADLVTLCLWMSLNREVLRKTTPHGETAVFHLLIPTYYPIVPEVPVMFHTNLFPLVVTSQMLRQEDLVGLDIRGDHKGLKLENIKELLGEIDSKSAFHDMLSSGQMVGSVVCSIASTVFPPAAPLLTPAVVTMISTGMTALVGALKTLVYQSITGEGTVVLGQPTLVDPRL